MRTAVIGGTGVEQIPGGSFKEEVVDTPYGGARVWLGQGNLEDLVFLSRHGVQHDIPPHRINYRANIKALQMLGVKRILASFAVGSIHESMPPRSLIAVDQFLDFTTGREKTFFDGGEAGLVHTEMTEPYCSGLRQKLLETAAAKGVVVHPRAVYVCTDGPRLETAAEIRMFGRLGGDVVGMTGVPEAPLARELGLHYAALAFSINWAAGVRSERIDFVEEGMQELKDTILDLFLTTLRSPEFPACRCEG